MYKVKISAVKQANYSDLSEQYENAIDTPCSINLGDTFISINAQKPSNFCGSAWETIKPFVTQLANGEGNFYNGWMRNPLSAMLSCNDGFRPVSFYIEVIK